MMLSLFPTPQAPAPDAWKPGRDVCENPVRVRSTLLPRLPDYWRGCGQCAGCGLRRAKIAEARAGACRACPKRRPGQLILDGLCPACYSRSTRRKR